MSDNEQQLSPTQPTEKRTYQRVLSILLVLATLLIVFVSMWDGAVEWMSLASLAFFFAIYALDGHASGDWMQYLKKNWFDLFLIILLTMPLLRILMLFNLAGLLPAIRISSLIHMHRKRLLDLIVFSQDSFPTAMGLVCGIIFIFGVSGYAFEHAVNPAFATLDDSLWWAVVTLTTVGYGDITPITGGGRIVAVLNMVFGVLVYSLVIANFTRLIEEHSEEKKAERSSQKKEP